MRVIFLFAALCLPVFGQVAAVDLGAGSKLSGVFFPDQGTASGCSGGTLKTNFGFTSLGPAFITAWSSAARDVKRNRLLFKGGGHSDYCGNELYDLIISGSTGTAHRIIDPSAWTADVYGTSGPNAWVNPDGSPVSAHAFGGIAELPMTDQIYMMPTGNPSGNVRNFTFLYNLASNTWTAKDPVTTGTVIVGGKSVTGFDPTSVSPSTSGQSCAHDPVTATVWCNMITNGYLIQYDASTNAYFKASQTFPQNQTVTFGVDPIRRQMWGAGLQPSSATNLLIGYVDLTGADSYVWHDMTASTTGCSGLVSQLTFPANAWPGWAHNPAIGKFVGWPNTGNTLYIFDPGTLQCTTQTFASPNVPSVATQLGTFGKFAYLPTSGEFVVVNSTANDAFAFPLNATSVPGLGASTTTCLDVDGDGYGVGPGCTGADADDFDSTVHTAAQAITKYGTLNAFLNHRGYNTSRVWLLSTSGNDGTCTVNGTACLTWGHVSVAMAAGDIALVHGGTWTGVNTTLNNGTAGNPTAFIAYPGELPFIDNRATGGQTPFDILSKSWIIIDGIKSAGGLSGGCIAGGNGNNVIIRYTETTECGALGGITAFNNMVDWTIEYNVMHDFGTNPYCNNCQHALYIGARGLANKNISVRRNIMYNTQTGYPAFQHNGRVTNLVVEQNMIYNTPGNAGAGFLEGVSNSRFDGNLLFNNGGGFTIANYDGDCYLGSGQTAGICPYDQTGNVISNNTIYIGNDPETGSPSAGNAVYVANNSTGCPLAWTATTLYGTGADTLDPSSHRQHTTAGGTSGSGPSWNDSGGSTTDGSVTWVDQGLCTQAKQGNLGGNTFINNNFIAEQIPVLFKSCTLATFFSTCALDSGETYLATSIFKNNIMWPYLGSPTSDIVFTAPGASYAGHNLTALNAGLWSGSSAGNINADPKLVAASQSYWNSPASYNLRLLSTSPAKVAGLAVAYPIFDALGALSSSTAPNIGAYEGSVGAGSGGSVSSGVMGGKVVR